MGQPAGKQLFTASSCIGMESCIGAKDLVYCRGYNIFQNLQRREYGTFQTCYPLWSTVRLSIL
jgi:hypothetical protein